MGTEATLSGVRVLDLTDGKGEMASRILADLGAEVIRVEAPTGARSRAQQPVVDGVSLYYSTHNANKRAVALDLVTDREQFLELIDTADILVESTVPGELEALGLAPVELRQRNPALVVVSITDFGRTGPYSSWAGTEWVHLALGGVLSRSGLPGCEPLMPPGSLAYESAAVAGAWAALAAYYNRLQTGIGDEVDLSVFESTVQVLDPGYGMAGSASGGVPACDGPRDRPDARHLYPVFPCADGAVRICILSPRQWQGMFAWLGEPQEFADPSLANLGSRFAAAGKIYPAIGALFATKTRAEIVAEGHRFGVPTAAVFNATEVMDAEQFTAREAFTELSLPDGRSMRAPNGFLEIDGQRAGLRRPAPGHGEHTEEILADLGLCPRAVTPTATTLHRRPFTGLRVLDLGIIVAGGEAGRLFADMGAEVIKIETSAFPDGSRQSITGEAMTAVFAWGHRNKESLGLNLRDPRGAELFKQLVAGADVILSNFKPGTMQKLGFGYEELAAINPGIVVLDSSAFGPTGPWSGRLGYGPLVRASAGLSALWRYPDDATGFCDASTVYPDHVAARIGDIGVVAALVRRHRTGRGGSVSVAQAEVILGQASHLLAAESVAPGFVRAVGNTGAGDAPRGLYPCAGDDEWLVIDGRGDEDWDRLTAAIGRPELATDPRFASPADRVRHREDIDALVREWTTRLSPDDAMTVLQAAGVPAGKMMRLPELPDNPHLLTREFFRTMRHPLVSRPMPSENLPARFRGIPDVGLRPAPMPGQDTREVAARLLELSDPAIQELIAEGVLEEYRPPAADLPTTTPALATTRP